MVSTENWWKRTPSFQEKKRHNPTSTTKGQSNGPNLKMLLAWVTVLLICRVSMQVKSIVRISLWTFLGATDQVSSSHLVMPIIHDSFCYWCCVCLCELSEQRDFAYSWLGEESQLVLQFSMKQTCHFFYIFDKFEKKSNELLNKTHKLCWRKHDPESVQSFV